jgi:hypothetical protein
VRVALLGKFSKPYSSSEIIEAQNSPRVFCAPKTICRVVGCDTQMSKTPPCSFGHLMGISTRKEGIRAQR